MSFLISCREQWPQQAELSWPPRTCTMPVLKQTRSMLRSSCPCGLCRRLGPGEGPRGMGWQHKAGVPVLCGLPAGEAVFTHTRMTCPTPSRCTQTPCMHLVRDTQFPGSQAALDNADTTVDISDKAYSRSSGNGREVINQKEFVINTVWREG